MDSKRFSDFSSGVQDIVAAIAIVIGGMWALYTFSALHSVQKAEAEIASLRQSAARQPVLQITLSPQQSKGDKVEATGARRIAVAVTVKNEGNFSLLFSTPQLDVAPLAAAASAAAMSPPRRYSAMTLDSDNKMQPMPERLLRAGQARTIAFAIVAPYPGAYLLQLKTVYSAGEIRGTRFVRGEITDGKFEANDDAGIEATEQAVVEVQ